MGTAEWAGRQAEVHPRRGGAAALIPQPGNPLAWDRYAYVRNNPLRYTDPSGHETCDLDGSCGYKRRHNQQAIMNYELRVYDYGIQFKGNWTKEDIRIMKETVYKLDIKFGGQRGSATRKVFGGTIFEYQSDMKGNYCSANQSTIVCGGTTRNYKYIGHTLAHELGHRFNAEYVNSHGNGDSPYTLLSSVSLKDNLGNHITGLLLDGEENKWKWTRTALGYKSGGMPNMAHGPAAWDDWNSNVDGIARNEDWADMFMNWLFDNFEGDSAGSVRYDWMDSTIRDVMGRW